MIRVAFDLYLLNILKYLLQIFNTKMKYKSIKLKMEMTLELPIFTKMGSLALAEVY